MPGIVSAWPASGAVRARQAHQIFATPPARLPPGPANPTAQNSSRDERMGRHGTVWGLGHQHHLLTTRLALQSYTVSPQSTGALHRSAFQSKEHFVFHSLLGIGIAYSGIPFCTSFPGHAHNYFRRHIITGHSAYPSASDAAVVMIHRGRNYGNLSCEMLFLLLLLSKVQLRPVYIPLASQEIRSTCF